jgi:hypothetical protein
MSPFFKMIRPLCTGHIYAITAFGFVILNEEKITALPKPGETPKYPQNVCPTILLSNTGKSFEKMIFKNNPKPHSGKNLLKASQFGF